MAQQQPSNADGSIFRDSPTSQTVLHGEQNSNFGLLGKSIFQSLPIGVAAFDRNLKIIELNPQASNLLELNDSIDATLAAGTNNPALG